jgi:hypothetical protein
LAPVISGEHQSGGKALIHPTEQFIGTVDVRTLHELDWPIFRLLAPTFVERLELRRYKRQLLVSGWWDRVRAVPHEDSSHVFDLYGVRAPQAITAGASHAEVDDVETWSHTFPARLV